MVVTKRWFLLFITLFAFIACKVICQTMNSMTTQICPTQKKTLMIRKSAQEKKIQNIGLVALALDMKRSFNQAPLV
jgi:hypothetical protein